MLRIAITPEILTDERNEATAIRILLDAGWDRVHLRHPGASRDDLKRVIEAIPQEFHNRLCLHGHFDLVNYFNLGGLHLNRRCPEPPALYRGPLSKSCHSIEELSACEGLAYATLSPIFDSLSKPGYNSRFSPDALTGLSEISVPVIALGGVTPERLPLLNGYNFSGFAMLGAIPWDKPDELEIFAKAIK